MISYISQVMTLANGIIGVSVLAMPYCFKQCGIILAILVLIMCSFLSRLACHFLIKSAVMSRRRNYEFLAFHAFGLMGKFSVELFIIGFLFGSCIAFFVVTGDLGSQIIGKMINKNPESIRISFMLTTAILIVLPLGLLRNIDSLSSVSTAAIGFYLCLIFKIIGESMGHIFRGDWYENVNFWRPAGILQCLPIVSMALFCQTQLFEIYESIPNVSLEKMNVVVKEAINFCTIVYLCVGFFGYIAFCNQSFSGNILMSFEQSLTSDIIKIGFVLSVIFSFPLCIFPCRASLNSLLFRPVNLHDSPSSYIPTIRFRCLTIIIVSGSMIIGILMPNIEFVLGFVGSTIGVMICLIFPAGFFIAISTKNTNERLLAQIILFIGIWIMILGSYANLYTVEESSTTKILITTDRPIIQMNDIQLNSLNENRPLMIKASEVNSKEKVNLLKQKKKAEAVLKSRNKWDEPPVEVKQQIVTEKSIKTDKLVLNSSINVTLKPDIKMVENEVKTLIEDKKQEENKVIQPVVLTAEEKMKAIEQEKIGQQNENLINSDAIKTKELEIAVEQAEDEALKRVKEEERIKNTLEQHRIESMQLLKEQKVLLQDIKKQKEEFEKDKKHLKDLESNKIKEKSLKNDEDDGKETIVNPGANDLPGSVNEESNKIEMKKETSNSTGVEALPKVKINDTISVSNVPSAVKSRGPVLSVLTNSVVQLNNSNVSMINNDNIINQSLIKNINITDNKLNLPIPLKLINQTKDKLINDTLERDVLEKHSLEKRDINESLKVNTNNNSSSNINDDKKQFKENINIIKNNEIVSDSLLINSLKNGNDSIKDFNDENDNVIVKKRDLKFWKNFEDS